MIYISDYGKMLDTIQSFVLQFSPEYSDRTQYSLSQNRYGVDWVNENCNEPANDLSIFFKVPLQKNESLIEYMFGNEGDDLMGSSVYQYIDSIFTKEKVADYLTEYYFYCKNNDVQLTDMPALLEKSGFGDDIRYHLLSFYIDMDRYIGLLQSQLVARFRLVERHFENSEAIISAMREELTETTFSDMDQELWNVTTQYNQIYYSICLISNYTIERRGLGVQNGENVCFTLGIHWKEKMLVASRKNKIDISLFGKIISEPNRMKIVNYLLEHEEITIALAVEYLETSVTATTYHLNMMYGARMLNARYEGRKIFYALNKEYFDIAIGMLRDLADRM